MVDKVPEETPQKDTPAKTGGVVETQERVQPPPVDAAQESPSGKTSEPPKTATGVQSQPQTSFTFQVTETSPFDALLDMSLDQNYVNILSPTLQSLGFTIENSYVADPISNETHQFTLVSRQGQDKRMLISIPDPFLENANRMNRATLKEIVELFVDPLGTETQLFIVYERPPNAVIDIVLKECAKQRGIALGYIPFSKINDLLPVGESFRVKIVRDIFLLEGLPQAGAVVEKPLPKPTIANIQRTEIIRLVEIVSDRPAFIDDKTHRRILVELSGLEVISENFNFDRGPKDVAFELINKILDLGIVPETGLHAAQMFLETVRDQEEDLPTDDRDYIESILNRYDFIA